MIEIIDEISTPLPMFMTRENSCCFTGHRGIPAHDAELLPSLLDHTVRELCSVGYKYFICGGALGFDMLAEQAVIRAIQENYGAELILALPCANQTEKWHAENPRGLAYIREYQRIKGYASSIRYSSQEHTPDCMKNRNEYMVSLSSFCVAYYNGAIKSGSGQTFRMAQKAGLDVLNLYAAIRESESGISFSQI